MKTIEVFNILLYITIPEEGYVNNMCVFCAFVWLSTIKCAGQYYANSVSIQSGSIQEPPDLKNTVYSEHLFLSRIGR